MNMSAIYPVAGSTSSEVRGLDRPDWGAALEVGPGRWSDRSGMAPLAGPL